MRKAYWLEFENESILNYLAKCTNFLGSRQLQTKADSKIQEYGGIENDPGIIINILES